MDLAVKTNQLFKSDVSKLQEELATQKALIRSLREELRSKSDQRESVFLYKSILQTVPNVVYRLDESTRMNKISLKSIEESNIWRKKYY